MKNKFLVGNEKKWNFLKPSTYNEYETNYKKEIK